MWLEPSSLFFGQARVRARHRRIMGFNEQMRLAAALQYVGDKQFVFITLAITDNQNAKISARRGVQQEPKILDLAFAPDFKVFGNGVSFGVVATAVLAVF